MSADTCPRTSEFVYGQTRGPIYRPLSGDLSALPEPALFHRLGHSGNQTKLAIDRFLALALGFLNRGVGLGELGKVARSARIRGEFSGQVLSMVLQPLQEAA